MSDEHKPRARAEDKMPMDRMGGQDGDNPQPLDYAQSARAAMAMSKARRATEDELIAAHRAAADADNHYRRTFAKAIVEERANHPATVAVDAAKGRDDVCAANEARKVAAGVVDAVKERMNLHGEDRASLHRLVEWSRMVAPDGQRHETEAGKGPAW